MSTINGSSGQHYISNAEILVWMQTKTDEIYTRMGNAMDVSNDRADAEDALNTINSKIADVQAGKGDPNELYALVTDAMKKYGTEFPDLNDTLSTISKELHDMGARLPTETEAPHTTIPAPPPMSVNGGRSSNPEYGKWAEQWGDLASQHPDWVQGYKPPAVEVNEGTAKRWTDAIKSRVDAFTKEDQLGLINIQEYNSQLNQAKNTASALMDSSDKASQNIISHIG